MSHGRSKASGGYAAALAEAADAEGILEAVMSDVQVLRRALADPSHGHSHGRGGGDGAGLQSFLLDPTVLDEHKKDVVETLGREAGFRECTLNLLRLIVERRRASILADMADRFEEIYNEITATEPVLVISAVKIDVPRLALIATKVQRLTGATNVRIRNSVDPSLVAGFVVRYGKHASLLLDLSVKSQLAQLARCISLPPDPPA
jgi:F-type H+-transporting ATPase subunit delta